LIFVIWGKSLYFYGQNLTLFTNQSGLDGRANINIRTLKRIVFLKDVFLLAISGFGGPQVHFVMFMRRLVHKKRYITEEELKELNSFCAMLPGPTSTQTITSIGFKLGGPLLAFFTLAVWIIPASVLMFLLAVLLSTYGSHHISLDFLKFVQPMAVGFMVFAALRISRMFARSTLEWGLLFLSAALAILIRSPFVFPLILMFGGFISNLQSKKRDAGRYHIKNVHWDNFILFISIFLVSAVVAALVKNFYGRDLARPFLVFENT
jgi:chromate transporter